MTVRTVIAALLVAASVLLVPPQAQAGAAGKESFFMSGQLGLNYYFKSGHPEDSQTQGLDLLFAPRVLYFPVKSIGVGGEANLYMYFDDTKQTNLAIGPRAAYYFKFNASRYARGSCLTPWFGSGIYWMPFFGVSLMYLMDRYSYS
jgi:hypothetical protein